MQLPNHPGGHGEVLEVGSEERPRTFQAIIHQERVVTEHDGQDVRDKAEDTLYNY